MIYLLEKGKYYVEAKNKRHSIHASEHQRSEETKQWEYLKNQKVLEHKIK